MSEASLNSAEPVIQCNAVSKTFFEGGNALTVFQDVSLQINPGERIAIVGSSGSGKSTLLHVLGGLDKPGHGDVLIAGQSVNNMGQAEAGLLRNRMLGFVYQFHHLLPEFTAIENVAMPLMIGGIKTATAMQRAKEMLKRVGLAARLEHKPSQLSGGERQRAAVARALVTAPKCVLADEPTGNLDHENATKVFDLMLELNKELGTSLVVVTHEMRLAERMDRVLRLDNSRLG